MATTIPNTPVVNQGLLYVNGLGLTWVDATHITVGIGQARDNFDINDIDLRSLVTINAAVRGLNGLDVGAAGALAFNTLYSVYVVGSSNYNDPTAPQYLAGGAVLSLATNISPTLPDFYDMYRRVGTVLTDGAGNILAFEQVGLSNDRRMWYDVAIAALAAGVSATYVAVPLGASVPKQNTEVTLNFAFTPTGPGDLANLRHSGSASTDGNVIISGAVAAVVQEVQVVCPCSLVATVPNIDYKCVGALTLTVAAYLDQL
jgi:hypothetical protein